MSLIAIRSERAGLPRALAFNASISQPFWCSVGDLKRLVDGTRLTQYKTEASAKAQSGGSRLISRLVVEVTVAVESRGLYGVRGSVRLD
jgi:hypothetical protein